MAQKKSAKSGKSGKKVANSLVVMSSAAVLAVYSAGYVRTRPAAEKFAARSFEREPARPNRPPTREVSTAKAIAPSPLAVTEPPKPPAEPHPAAAPKPEPKRESVAARNSADSPKINSIAAAKPPEVEPATPLAHKIIAPETTASVAAAPVTSPAAAIPVAIQPIQPTEGSTAAPSTPSTTPAPKVWKDGKYTAWGSCRHGDLEATVVIEGGRIVSAQISNCQTRYPCDIIDKLPPQVVKRQTANVDRIGGATESADAFYAAVYWALDQAK